ncbi:MAG: MerR family transcriptional regulator [Acidimicrobiales bacterium]|nr:MerR family transcriptional regulator [Acidimicrobiales bacterium]
MLLRIGEYARLLGIPVRTVRFYSDNGLLPPTEVDPTSGYRYYGLERLEHGRRLLTLKALGLPLGEIKAVLESGLDDDTFRAMLERHVVRLEGELHQTTEQLTRARAHLHALTLKQDPSMADITITTSKPKTIAYIRDQITDPSGIARMFPRLFESVDLADVIDVGGNIYYEFADDGSYIDLEAVMPVADDYQATGEAKVRRIEPAMVATITHHGSFNRIHEAYEALLTWIADNGYEVTGPSYEWNIVCTPPVVQDNETYVTEIQIEVGPAN